MSNLIDVDVLVNGKPVTKFSHEGDTFIEGRSGSEYLLKIKNKTPQKIEVVISIDGLSIITGEPASDESSGYVISGYQTVEIKGWRVSDTNVAKFVFGDKEKSYTVKLGNSGSDAGVIGVIAFPQKFVQATPSVIYYQPNFWDTNYDPRNMLVGFGSIVGSYYTPNTNMSAVASSSLLNESVPEQLGTGFGEEVKSVVTSTTFERGVGETLSVIYYDSRKGLEARGIVVDTRKLKPDPFPASKTNYCKRV